jgi:hypothetical protein
MIEIVGKQANHPVSSPRERWDVEGRVVSRWSGEDNGYQIERYIKVVGDEFKLLVL